MKEQTKSYIAYGLVGLAIYLWLTQSGRDIAAQIGEEIMKISDSGLNLIASSELFSATPYADADGQSIGYGHFILPGELGNTIVPPISHTQGLQLLNQDAAIADNAVSQLVTVPLSQNQHDALCDLVYNIGVGNFQNSTLLRLLNQGDYDGAAAQFKVWNQSQGAVLQSLVDRRAAEASLFMTA